MRVASSTFALVLILSASLAAPAAPITYNVTNGTTTSGGTFSGSFTVDANDVFTGGSFTAVGGGIDATYNFTQAGASGSFVAGNFEFDRGLFSFAVLASDNTAVCSTVVLCRNSVNGRVSSSFSTRISSDVTGATITLAAPVAVTPEPSSIALLSTGILSMAAVLRRRLRLA